MSLQQILLGMLQTPATGYDLKGMFDNSIRYFWSAELSQIYPTLKHLEKEGLLRHTTKPSAKGPHRKVYALTARGRKALEAWVTDDPHLGDARYGFVAQLFFMDAADDIEATLRFLTKLRDTLQERIRIYQRIKKEWVAGKAAYPDPDSNEGFHQLLALKGGLCHMKARITWCNESINEVKQRMEADLSARTRNAAAPIRREEP